MTPRENMVDLDAKAEHAKYLAGNGWKSRRIPHLGATADAHFVDGTLRTARVRLPANVPGLNALTHAKPVTIFWAVDTGSWEVIG